MNKNLKIRLLADSGMTLALLLLMSYQLVGEKAHEWIGMAMFLLVIGHHVLNRRWMGNITRGKYTVHRILQTVIVILLALTMIGSMVSGILLSNYIFRFVRIKGVANLARSIHILCAYWGFLFIAVHLGLHWNMMLRILEKVFPMKGVAKIPGLLIAVYGGYAFYKRGIVNYLFLKSHFVFFGPQESLGLFLPDYIAMIGMIVFVTYYGDRLLFGDKGIIWHIWRR